MDINRGNDIQVKFKLKNVKPVTRADIKSLECYFINIPGYGDPCRCISNIPGESFPQYHNPTPYTIRSCGYPTYNVDPVNCMGHHTWDRFCGFGVNTRRVHCENDMTRFHCMPSYTCYIPDGWDSDQPLNVVFPAHDQKLFGDYKFVVRLTAIEDGWGDNNLHEYTLDFGNIFKLVKAGGTCGDITITIDN